MLLLSVAAALTANVPQTPGLKALVGLAGCWSAPGQVRGKDATSVARGEWHLGKRYFILHLHSIAPKLPYEAAIVYGAGQKPEEIGSFWMDTFGGAYGTMGAGAPDAAGFTVIYTYPDSVYTNRFERMGKGWKWTIMEKAPDKPERLFAEYNLTPRTCSGAKFDF